MPNWIQQLKETYLHEVQQPSGSGVKPFENMDAETLHILLKKALDTRSRVNNPQYLSIDGVDFTDLTKLPYLKSTPVSPKLSNPDR